MPPPLKIFIVYARKDAEFKDELVYHLKPLKMLGLVDTWHDGDLQPGAEWDVEIKNQLRQADIVIPLVSTYFINSDYIQGTEFKEARQRWEQNETEIAPIVVRDCLWEELADLSDLQALPSDGKRILPVNQWADRDQAWTIIANGLKQLCTEIRTKRGEYEGKAQKSIGTEKSKIVPPTSRLVTDVQPLFWKKYYTRIVSGAAAVTLLALSAIALLNNKNLQLESTADSNLAQNVSQMQLTEPEMVFVRGGTFVMGCNPGKVDMECDEDEKPSHKVTLDDFYLGKFEVTQAQWKALMGDNPSFFKNCDNCPIESVSWNEVQVFLEKLNQKTSKKYRLPTEAEWEYAARGGQSSKGFFFSGNNNLEKVAWYNTNSATKTHSVGQLRANELGIYDMSGNVFEWCSDWFDLEYYSAQHEFNPKGPEKDTARALRGGSWFHAINNSRVANRAGKNPDSRNSSWGFRVAMDAKAN